MTPELKSWLKPVPTPLGQRHAHHRDHAGDHVLHIAFLPAAQGLPDRAAEDEHEQQGEDDRHQQCVGHRLRVLADPQQVAADQGAGVTQMAAQRDTGVRLGVVDGDGAHTAAS
ncbi:hypothetical protein QFZ43_006633 [Streptomyces afghaniensis]|nr:hypothetical protein [Streptomyces afghaniensis]